MPTVRGGAGDGFSNQLFRVFHPVCTVYKHRQIVYKYLYVFIKYIHFYFQVEISDNSLVCDCKLKWFITWSNINSNLIPNFINLRCALPISLADEPIKKLNPSDLTCSSNGLDDRLLFGTQIFSNPNTVRLSPSNPQVVFEEDSLSFHCQVDR